MCETEKYQIKSSKNILIFKADYSKNYYSVKLLIRLDYNMLLCHHLADMIPVYDVNIANLTCFFQYCDFNNHNFCSTRNSFFVIEYLWLSFMCKPLKLSYITNTNLNSLLDSLKYFQRKLCVVQMLTTNHSRYCNEVTPRDTF